ncbi:3-phosphoshikimate 1-carboxyvinyltransferase [Chloroflexota bacterium]
MRVSIYKSGIKGSVKAPPSKSYTIRGLVCAALANGKSEILNPLTSDDTEACQDVLRQVGIRIKQGKNSWEINGGKFEKPQADLFCRESAAALRFMTAISSVIPGQCRLTAAPSLARRPIRPLIGALEQLGVDCRYQDSDSSVIVNGANLKGGTADLPGNISSQFVSSLLFISPFAEEGIIIELTTTLESRPFVLMTIECLKSFGIKVNYSEDMREFRIEKQSYKPTEYMVEGDWSSASYLLALGALSGEAEVGNLNPESAQGDKAILDILRDMGASVSVSGKSIMIRISKLKSIKTNLADCIDLLPTVAVLAATADGTSELTGIERARLKESDRPSALKEGLERMGVKVVEEKNKMIVTGSQLKGSVIDTRGDHRIAMAFSLLGTVAGETIIENAECVSKTYPEYWDALKKIGGEVKIDE